MKKKVFRIFASAAVLGAGVLGTAAASYASAATHGGKVTIRYMLWDPNEEVGYKKSIAVFEKLHPNIHVQIEEVPWAQYWQKLQTEMVAGTAPDVFWDHVTYFPQFVQTNQLMDLTPLIKKDKVNLSIYYPNLLKQYKYKGGIYGLPKDWDTIAIIYNKNLIRKAGISEKTLNSLTWNPKNGGTLLSVAQKLTLDVHGKHPNQKGFDPKHVKQYGFLSYNSNQSFYFNFIAMNGGKIMDKPSWGTKFLLDSPQSVAALQNLVDWMYKYHISPPGSESANSNAYLQLFAEGKVAMYTDGDWDLTPVYNTVKFPIGVALLPVGPKGRVSVMNGLSDAIYARTQHPQEAWELEKWLASPQSQKILASGGYVWPGIKSLTPLFEQAWKKRGVDVTPFLEESKGKTISFPIVPHWNQAGTDINTQFSLLWLGKISAQQAATAATQKANQDISQ